MTSIKHLPHDAQITMAFSNYTNGIPIQHRIAVAEFSRNCRGHYDRLMQKNKKMDADIEQNKIIVQ